MERPFARATGAHAKWWVMRFQAELGLSGLTVCAPSAAPLPVLRRRRKAFQKLIKRLKTFLGPQNIVVVF